jgi:hypothetical protein
MKRLGAALDVAGTKSWVFASIVLFPVGCGELMGCAG